MLGDMLPCSGFTGILGDKGGVTFQILILWRIECIGVHVDLANCSESRSPRQLMWVIMPSSQE